MSDIAKTVGKRLRCYRQAQGLSQERLAELAGLHPTYIERLEKITVALQVSMSGVFELGEERNEEDNYPLLAYNFFSGRKPEKGRKLYEILTQIDEYSKL